MVASVVVTLDGLRVIPLVLLPLTALAFALSLALSPVTQVRLRSLSSYAAQLTKLRLQNMQNRSESVEPEDYDMKDEESDLDMLETPDDQGSCVRPFPSLCTSLTGLQSNQSLYTVRRGRSSSEHLLTPTSAENNEQLFARLEALYHISRASRKSASYPIY